MRLFSIPWNKAAWNGYDNFYWRGGLSSALCVAIVLPQWYERGQESISRGEYVAQGASLETGGSWNSVQQSSDVKFKHGDGGAKSSGLRMVANCRAVNPFVQQLVMPMSPLEELGMLPGGVTAFRAMNMIQQGSRGYWQTAVHESAQYLFIVTSGSYTL